MADDPWALPPPNIRSALIPDPGFVFVEVDLSGADAQVVAWDAGAETLKRDLREAPDLHSPNAFILYGKEIGDPRKSLHLNGMSFRDNAKRAVHLTNYAGGYRTLATSCSISESRASSFIRFWTVEKHPAIGEWHARVEYNLRRSRYPVVRNAWGYRKLFTDRNDSHLIGQALAWIAQSTVSITINEIMTRLDCCLDLIGMERCGRCLVCLHGSLLRLALQVHDSVLMQVETRRWPEIAPLILSFCSVIVPYPDPLCIPVEMKWSEQNWGSMEKLDLKALAA